MNLHSFKSGLQDPIRRTKRDQEADVTIPWLCGEDTSIGARLTGATRWVARLAAHPCAWIVEHEQRLLGEVRLDAFNRHDARSQLAVGLYDPAKLGIGPGREVVRLVLAHAFGALGLHRVGLRVISYNERAIRCYRAYGFVEEGREREAALVGGERHDDIIMGVLAREFAPAAKSSW